MKKVISVILLISVFVVSVFSLPSSAANQTGAVISATSIYTDAGTDNTHTVDGGPSTAIKSVSAGTTFEVLEQKNDGDGDLWYKVKLSDGTEGYLYSAKVSLDNSTYDEDFEKC